MKAACHLLLVQDDDQLAEQMIASLEETENLVTKRVRSEAAALEYMALSRVEGDGRRPDIILLDCRLECAKLLETIRQTPAWADVPVIVLAEKNGDVSKDQLYRLYANSILVRPSDPAEFRAMMRDVGRYWGRWNQLPHT